MQLSSQAGTLAHRGLGSLGTWALVDVDYRSCFCFWYSTGVGAGAKGDCACASLILQSGRLRFPNQVPSYLLLSNVVTAFSTFSTFSGSRFLNACFPHGECRPAPLAVLICPLAQDAHKHQHRRHNHHSHRGDCQPDRPWTKLARRATEKAKGAAAILDSYQPTPGVEEARPCHSAEQNPPELYFYVAAPCASATALCNTSILDGSFQS